MRAEGKYDGLRNGIDTHNLALDIFVCDDSCWSIACAGSIRALMAPEGAEDLMTIVLCSSNQHERM